MKSVITISREAGSSGDAIGYELASRLGYTCVNRSFVDLIARKARVAPWQVERVERSPEAPHADRPAGFEHAYDERRGRDLDRLIRRLGYGEQLDTEEYLKALRDVMHDLAAIGQVVIIGRGGQVMLHDLPEAFHVRILAPEEERIAEMQRREEISREWAVHTVSIIDSLRAELLRRIGWEEDDHKLYDLILQTEGKSVDRCADEIVGAIEAASRESEFEPVMGRLE